ncbi:MAG: BMP family protein [Myxococcales bacterium]
MHVRRASAALRLLAALLALSLAGCSKKSDGAASPGAVKVGLVTDVGGRGDQSFNDAGLRGLEQWAAGRKYATGGYAPLSPEERAASIPEALRAHVGGTLDVTPVVLQAKQQEDYGPNLELLVEDGVKLAIGVGFMLENAVESTAKKHPAASFLLIDSPILDAKGTPTSLPNVRTVTFREHEGSFLAGALAGLVTKSGVVGFVGGMQIPLIRKFEAGFRAGLRTTNPEAEKALLVAYTGSFDKVEAGKQVAQDMLLKKADVLFHAAGGDGLGVIAAVKEAGAWAIGCDSDQHHVAPDHVLTSMLKRVDLAVYLAVKDVAEGKFTAGHSELGLKDGAVDIAPVRSARLPDRDALLEKVDALKQQIVEGGIEVPATLEALAKYQPPQTAAK